METKRVWSAEPKTCDTFLTLQHAHKSYKGISKNSNCCCNRGMFINDQESCNGVFRHLQTNLPPEHSISSPSPIIFFNCNFISIPTHCKIHMALAVVVLKEPASLPKALLKLVTTYFVPRHVQQLSNLLVILNWSIWAWAIGHFRKALAALE